MVMGYNTCNNLYSQNMSIKKLKVGVFKTSDYDLDGDARIEKYKDYDFISCENCDMLENNSDCRNCHEKELFRKRHLTVYGLCSNCNSPNESDWCKECNAKRFQQRFEYWTSRNDNIDRFIQETQLSAWNNFQVLEWIPFSRFRNVKFLDEGGFSIVYEAIWLDGPIRHWDNDKKLCRYNNDMKVVFKSLKNTSNKDTNDNDSSNSNEKFEKFLNEVRYYILFLYPLISFINNHNIFF